MLGGLAEEVLDFADTYPDCLPSEPFDRTNASDMEGFAMDMLAQAEWNPMPLKYAMSSDVDGEFYGSEYGWELPIWVNNEGNLCTDMDYVEDDTKKVFLAFNDGIFDASANLIDSSVAASDYP